MDYSGNASYPLGMRNNNPGDLRDDGTQWQGMTGSNSGFCVFSDSTYGLRALALDLTNKMNNDGLTTITEIITVYAPPSENDTQSYIDNVSAQTGFEADQTLTPDAPTIAALVRAITIQEVGAQYSAMIPDADIQTALSMLPNPLVASLGSFLTANPELQQSAGFGVIAVILVGLFVIWKYRKRIIGGFKTTTL
jgi:hypothetical protein